MSEYRSYLYRYFWRRLAPITVVNNLILGYIVSGWIFGRGTFPSPLLDIFAVVACVGLDIVAMTAIWQISAYINPWSKS